MQISAVYLLVSDSGKKGYNSCLCLSVFSALNYSRWELSHRYQKGKSEDGKKTPCGNNSHNLEKPVHLSVFLPGTAALKETVRVNVTDNPNLSGDSYPIQPFQDDFLYRNAFLRAHQKANTMRASYPA